MIIIFFGCNKLKDTPPNIIFILTDDLAYADLSSYGSEFIDTPNLDKMADDGLKMTSYYAPQAVCSASRAAILTGCYPNRLGISGAFGPKSKRGINPNELLLSEMLQSNNYKTGIFGKWHLGDQPEFLPTKQGFDEYFGIPYSNDMWPPHPPAQNWEVDVCPLPLIRQKEVIDTVDSMGANFINSCLEKIANTMQNLGEDYKAFIKKGHSIEVIMSILSNYIPHCIVQVEVRCPINELRDSEGISGQQFAKKFIQAVEIAKKEPYRAVTHNKGIMNGVDAVVIATGNDFRAVEAGVHAYAAQGGTYSSLSHAFLEGEEFIFQLKLPLSLGTVGGLTQLHPMVRWSIELLGKPDAKKLMEIAAVAGLAQNFAAIKSLITSGIQKGHMKLHLLNILNQHNATDTQKEKAIEFFKTHTVSFSSVTDFLDLNP